MSRGGRGRGGQSGSPRGGGKGRGFSRGSGGGSSWPGEGRRLDEGETSSTRGNGRGRGRGGPVRGMGYRVNAQNAVGYDYGTPLQSGQQTPEEQDVLSEADASNDDDDDVVLETHRTYRHVAKPHMEQVEAPQRYIATNDAGTSMMLPPSVSNLNARSPSNLVAMERAQRAMEGQVAGLIPTGPKSAHVHRMYGTLDAVHQRNRNRHQEHQQYPLPVSTNADDRKKKGKFDRPADNNAGDPCLAGIPRSTPRRELPSKFNLLGKGGSGNLQLPVKFEKASGEWRDGAWVRSSDGKELANVESIREAAQEAAHPSDPFDRASGAGLGFHSTKQAAPMEDDVWAMEREQHDEEDDPIAALLKLHPGSTEMQEEDSDHDESLGYYQGSMGLLQAKKDTNAVIESEIKTALEEPRLFVSKSARHEKDEEMDETSSEDEEVILIPQVQVADGPSRMVESDSEEERQLDAIIKQNEQVTEIEPAAEQTAGFFVDLTGEAEQAKADSINYEVTSSAIIGEQNVAVVVDTEMIAEDSDEEERKLNRTHKQPKASGKKARNAAKKARRRAKGRSNIDSEPLVAREGDSDLDWGSDGPPVQFKKKADQDSFVQGVPMQQLSLNVFGTPHSKDEEDEMVAIALAESVESTERSTKGKKPANTQSFKEAIIQDYMENAMGSDEEEDEGKGDIVTERRDERKINKKTDLDALLQFMNGMDGQRNGKEMTLEDIAIENQMQEEVEWMTEECDGDDEEESEGKKFDDAVNKEERKAIPDESADDSDSDESESSEDAKPRKQKKESWSDSDDSEDDDNDDEDFDRHFSWADADEAFISRIDKFANANGSILKGRDRKARNRLFKMIETGNFDNLDEEDMIIDDEDPVFGRGALKPVKGGKKSKTWGENHVFAEQLETQWQKDRAQKADNKRKRAAERAAAAENPYHGTQIKKGTKKMAKKAARAERRANKLAGGRMLVDDDEFEGENNGNTRHATNLFELDKQIQLFLRDTSKTTLSLSPMDKRARAQVHLLANCYNLTSKSIGNGSKRFPTLIKNQRSGFNVNFAKVNSVLNGSRGSFGSGYKSKDSNGVKVKDRASGVGAHVPKNQEGAAVGYGADRIGEDNIGHRLLTMMGWSEGSGVGRTQGAAEPVGATIKVTKSGLGF